jgi:NhaA family Na+:H+ antiporter
LEDHDDQRQPGDAVRRVVDPVKGFLHTEAAGGLFLLAATVVALGWANSPFAAGYEGLWGRELTIGAGSVRARVSVIVSAGIGGNAGRP